MSFCCRSDNTNPKTCAQLWIRGFLFASMHCTLFHQFLSLTASFCYGIGPKCGSKYWDIIGEWRPKNSEALTRKNKHFGHAQLWVSVCAYCTVPRENGGSRGAWCSHPAGHPAPIQLARSLSWIFIRLSHFFRCMIFPASRSPCSYKVDKIIKQHNH